MFGQTPEIARNGVVNAAANAPVELAERAIARGAVLNIRGKLFNAKPSATSAKLSGRTGEVSLAILSANSDTVAARVPTDAPLGAASLTLVVAGRKSQPYPVNIVPSQFGIYAMNGKGWGPGRIQHLDESGTRHPNNVSDAATFGQQLALLGTGLGDAKSPSVVVGGRPARVLATHSSRDGDEIIFRVPENAPQGCFVPVQVRGAGPLVSNTVTVAIQRGGGHCRMPGYFPFAGWPGAAFGMVAITRTIERQYGGEPAFDEASAWFGRLPALDQVNPYFLLPPPGTCTGEVEPWRGGFVPATLMSLLAARAGVRALRAGGEFGVDDGKTFRRVPEYRGVEGVFDREFSDFRGRADQLFRFLSPTVVHVVGKGGADVGPFRFALTGPRPFQMSSVMGPVRKGQEVRLEWTEMGTDRIPLVFANFVDEATGSRGMCYCVGTPGANGLTIPASTLAYFPPSSSSTRVSLTVTAWPLQPFTFQAAGLDHTLAVSVFMQNGSLGPSLSSFRARN